MKKFSLKLLLVILPFFVAYIYIEHQLSKIPNSYNLKRKYLEAQLKNIQVLQLGDSHTFLGIDPSYFSYYGFNLSNVSQTVYYDTRLVAKYIDQMPALKIILLPASYETFRDQLRTSTEVWRAYYYYAYWGIDDPAISYLKPERYSKIAMYNINEVKKFAKSKFKVNLAKELQPNGYEKNDSAGSSKRINDAAGSERIAFLNKEIKATYRDENFDDLKRLLELLKNRHIKIVFINTPVYSTYYKYADQKVVADNDSLVNCLCSQYHSSYYNYFTDKRFVITDFADNDHLSFVGAEKLSKIIDSEIIRPEMKL